MMWGFGGWGMIWMLAFWAGVILLIVWGVRQTSASGTTRENPNRAVEILEERYARGEIDRNELQTRRADLNRG